MLQDAARRGWFWVSQILEMEQEALEGEARKTHERWMEVLKGEGAGGSTMD